MNRKNQTLIALFLLLVALATGACSLNRQTPKELDQAAIEADVRAAIAAAVPGKTFDLGVTVSDSGAVRLTGNVDSSSDRDAVVAKVRQVNGVTSVDASGLTVS